MRRAAYLLCHDTHQADDLVQSALASVYVKWASIRSEDAYAYVRRSLVNGFIDGVRKHPPLPFERVPDRVVALDTSVEERSQLVELLAPLSARERTIIVWRYYFDAPEAEVAERLGISVGTVKSTASRALSRLRAVSAPTAAEGVK